MYSFYLEIFIKQYQGNSSDFLETMAASAEETRGYSWYAIDHRAQPAHWEPRSSATSAGNLQGHYLSELLLFSSAKWEEINLYLKVK